MQSQAYLVTLADPAQIPGLIKRGFLKGYAQRRIAFVGRSNVGKSSLINALMAERIARVSSTPGKTRAIHFFLWEKTDRIIADLPGYGFAERAQSEKRGWAQLLDAYFEADSAIEVVLLLWDSRHGPMASDLEALDYFLSKSIPIQIVMTKSDQIKKQSDRIRRQREIEETIQPFGIDYREISWVSTHDQKSIELLRRKFK